VRESVEPVEEIRVGDNRRAFRCHMQAYMTWWRRSVKPCEHGSTPRPATRRRIP
jgi:hypothetical protein